MDTLISKLIDKKNARLEKYRKRYALAKKLGLPANLAGSMTHWSEEKIRFVAEEYKYEIGLRKDDENKKLGTLSEV